MLEWRQSVQVLRQVHADAANDDIISARARPAQQVASTSIRPST